MVQVVSDVHDVDVDGDNVSHLLESVADGSGMAGKRGV